MSNNLRGIGVPLRGAYRNRKDLHFVGSNEGVDVWLTLEGMPGRYVPVDLLYSGAHHGSTGDVCHMDPTKMWEHLEGLTGYNKVVDIVRHLSAAFVQMDVFNNKCLPVWWQPYQPQLGVRMSYDIYAVTADKTPVQLAEPFHGKGGTYQVYGTTEAHLNVTYNYSEFFHRALDEDKGIRVLYGMQVLDSLPLIAGAIAKLDKESKTFDIKTLKKKLKDPGALLRSLAQKEDYTPSPEDYEEWKAEDYWAPTPHNAAKALLNLLSLAAAVIAVAPEAVWDGD